MSKVKKPISPSPKIKHLRINPLSIAKFFYEVIGERGIEQPFIQPITYLAYSEVLKKENLLLFKEEFTPGIASPILPSLTNLIRNHGDDLESFFSQVPDITNRQVLSHLEKLLKKHANSLGCEVQYQAQRKNGRITI